jgi:hypothetical protein
MVHRPFDNGFSKLSVFCSVSNAAQQAIWTGREAHSGDVGTLSKYRRRQPTYQIISGLCDRLDSSNHSTRNKRYSPNGQTGLVVEPKMLSCMEVVR